MPGQKTPVEDLFEDVHREFDDHFRRLFSGFRGRPESAPLQGETGGLNRPFGNESLWEVGNPWRIFEALERSFASPFGFGRSKGEDSGWAPVDIYGGGDEPSPGGPKAPNPGLREMILRKHPGSVALDKQQSSSHQGMRGDGSSTGGTLKQYGQYRVVVNGEVIDQGVMKDGEWVKVPVTSPGTTSRERFQLDVDDRSRSSQPCSGNPLRDRLLLRPPPENPSTPARESNQTVGPAVIPVDRHADVLPNDAKKPQTGEQFFDKPWTGRAISWVKSWWSG